MPKLTKDYNLEVLYPEIAKEWHPTKNGKLNPNAIKPMSHKLVWWKCNKGHEWKANINTRANQKTSCPFCINRRVGYGNDLATKFPELSKEWNYEKNNLLPSDVVFGSPKKVWWKCNKGHEWKAKIVNRTRKTSPNKCPFCPKKNTGFSRAGYGNDLKTNFPKLSKEWHPKKNGDLKPNEVLPGSAKKVWWKCNKGHEWKATVHSRAKQKTGCRFCSTQTSRKELYLFSELSALFGDVKHRVKYEGKEIDILISKFNIAIEYDGEYYHRNKLKYDILKKDKLNEKFILVSIREEPLKKIFSTDYLYKYKSGKNFDFVKSFINHLLEQKICKSYSFIKACKKYLKNDKPLNESFFNEMISYLPGPLPGNSLEDLSPKIANEWHPKKNKNLLPSNFHNKSTWKAWWICNKGHEYKAAIDMRTQSNRKSTGCPYCANQKIGYGNDLVTQFPNTAKRWHPTKNGDLKPNELFPKTNNKYWWICEKKHEYFSTVNSQTVSKRGCPYCRNKRVGYGNDLATQFPNTAKRWHPTKNGDLKPNEVLPGSAKKVWWKCENNHEYFAHIRVQTKSGCKKCLGVSQGFNVYKDGKKIGYWNNQKDCASDLGLKIQLISRCLNNEEKTHKGYNFKKI